MVSQSTRRATVGLGGIALVAFGAFAAYGWHSAIAPIKPPLAATFPQELVARGAILAGAGNCASCHTPKGEQAFSGGYPIKTNFGTIYSSNITPDAATGIGTWSQAAFARALHQGVARDGSHLFPAFPYDHFTKVTDDDVAALYAFFMTQAPVSAAPKQNTLPFPLNIRFLQAGWKLLFFHSGRYVADSGQTEAWNRGAYLAQGVGHCGACHTPRNFLGAEKTTRAFAGATIDDWWAPPLTKANPAPLPWQESDVYAYLRDGFSPHQGFAGGPMKDVIDHGLATLPDDDILALANYFADVNGTAASGPVSQELVKKVLSLDALGVGQPNDAGARIYIAACASCHYNNGAGSTSTRPSLAVDTSMSSDDPTKLIAVILYGRSGKMPGFAAGFSNADIATLAAYLRQSRSTQAPWTNLESTVATVRAKGKIDD